MLPLHLALVTEVTQDEVSASDLNSVAAALQKQVTRDFGPIWNVEATMDAYASLNDVPLDYWPIIVRDDINMPGAAGVHEDENGQPFALVQYSATWSLTASHECLEMLADPSGNRVVAGAAPDLYLQDRPGGSARVEYLMEVCDPCEDSQFAYTVNGVTVSDFITPHFYDPLAANGVRYSYGGSIEQPRQVLQGGYVSFHDPMNNQWYQVQFFDSAPQIKDLGVLGRVAENLRSTIDGMTTHPELVTGIKKPDVLERLGASRKAVADASAARAKALHSQIDALKQRHTGRAGGGKGKTTPQA